MSLYVKHSMGGDYPPRIVCFVCGTEGPADYPLYTSPHGVAVETSRPLPHFPFLLELTPPLGCRAPDQASAASACRTCYSSLMRQWDDNERGGVPVENRVYCHKRAPGLPVLSAEQQLTVNRSAWRSITKELTELALLCTEIKERMADHKEMQKGTYKEDNDFVSIFKGAEVHEIGTKKSGATA